MSSAPLAAVFTTVCLGLASALILKETADRDGVAPWVIAAAIVAVLTVNVARFVVWGRIYRRHPVSMTYPLGSMFFPLVLAVGHYAYEEPANASKVVGSLMVMAGVAVLTTRSGEVVEP